MSDNPFTITFSETMIPCNHNTNHSVTYRALGLIVANAGNEALSEVETPACSLDCERGCRSHATGLASLDIRLLTLAKFGERVQLWLGSGWNKACRCSA